MLQVAALPRDFSYNGHTFVDPDPALSVEEVRNALASGGYPELNTAAIEGPETTNGTLRYTFVTKLGSKA